MSKQIDIMLDCCLLPYNEYSLYNALAWGNFRGHCYRAIEADWCGRIVHIIIVALEFFPLVSQIVSLFELAIAKAYNVTAAALLDPPSIDQALDFTSLARQQICQVIPAQEQLLHPYRVLVPKVEKEIVPTVNLPADLNDLSSVFFEVNRLIDRQYLQLPWPKEIQNVVVVTEIQGGRGDLAAAAKVISLMQDVCPTLNFDWILSHLKDDPLSFIASKDLSKISLRTWESISQEKEAGDFLLVGPVKTDVSKQHIEKWAGRRVNGPLLHFIEIAGTSYCSENFLRELVWSVLQTPLSDSSLEIYRTKVHPLIFKCESQPETFMQAALPMSLQKGSGVFLNEDRLTAPLSRGYCCPFYTLQIEDADLRKDVLEALNVFDGHSIPDYDQYSLNSGYAHRLTSWEKFIDFVAIHEREKHLTIILNQQGYVSKTTTQEFAEQIFTPQRLAFLKKLGYGTIAVKGQEKDLFVMQESFDLEKDRRLFVIVRPSFKSTDMKWLQLASERLLATGDNSATEAWSARCKLYLYEYVANMGCKKKFLEQQVKLAGELSSTLSQLLDLFGSHNVPLTKAQMQQATHLLQDPALSDATLQFCDMIIANYSFRDVLTAALKRMAWHAVHPELMDMEASMLDEEFRTKIIAYMRELSAEEIFFQKKSFTPQSIALKQLPLLAERLAKFTS